MTTKNAAWIDDARGTLETLVESLDDLPEEFECIPQIVEILNYINTQCRELVRQANA